MAFSGDPEVFNETGPVIKSAELDPQGREGVYERFAVPVSEDIVDLQDFGPTLANATEASITDLADGAFLSVVLPDGSRRKASLSTLNVAIGAGGRPVLTKEDLGLEGDGLTDDAPALQREAEIWSGRGGAVFMLRAEAGETFRFEGTYRGASNISILFASPHEVTATSRLTLSGEMQATIGADDFLLVVDVAEGDTTARLSTSNHGGVDVSTLVAVGDLLRFRGIRDSAGTPLAEDVVRVTAVASDQVTFTPALRFDYEVDYDAGAYEAAQGLVNRTNVAKIVTATPTSNVDAGSNLVPIAVGDIGKITAGDYVLVIDEATCADTAGSSAAPVNMELARVVASVTGDASASVRLSRRLERSYTTAENFRVVKLDPIINSSIQGASVEFTETPPAGTFVAPYETAYAVDCVLGDVKVPNTDEFGTRGSACRIYRSLSCDAIDVVLRDPQYVGDGEGNGVSFVSSTDCRSRGGTFDGSRHAIQFVNATNCLAVDPIIQNPRHSPLDWHGQNEIGCRVVNATMTASTTYEALEGSAPAAMAFGNPTFLNGPHRSGVSGGRVIGFKAETGVAVEPCIQFFPGSTNCYVREVEFRDISTLWGHADVAGAGTIVSSGHRLVNLSVDGCGDWLVNLDGRANGASVDTLSDVKITGLVGRNLGKLMLATNVTELELLRSDLDEITVDATRTYVLEADTCPGLTVVGNIFKGAGRGLRLTTCTNFRVANNTFLDLANATTFRDEGSNTGEWVGNETCGFVESATIRSSVIKEGPRAAGVVTMADDTAFSFFPERTQGIVQVFSHNASTLYGAARYRVLASGNDCDLISGLSTANVAVTTGALAGTTGTDTNFTISAHTDGRIYLENRTGSSVNVDFSTS